jgi:hypothetical protein
VSRIPRSDRSVLVQAGRASHFSSEHAVHENEIADGNDYPDTIRSDQRIRMVTGKHLPDRDVPTGSVLEGRRVEYKATAAPTSMDAGYAQELKECLPIAARTGKDEDPDERGDYDCRG